MSLLNTKFKFLSPYLVTVPLALTSAGSGYGLLKNANLLSSIEHNYLARLQLNSDKDNSGKLKVEGKEYDLSKNQEKEKLVSETAERLNNFYKKYSSDKVSVNIVKNNSNSIDFFLHFRSYKESKNLNNLWLKNVRLNQLSIDRYGHDFDNSGNKKNDSSLKVHKLVDWKNVGTSGMKLKSAEGFVDSHILFNIFEKSIPEDELKILTNKEEGKYKAEGGADNSWFVWLDKDLLALKLNYIFQTYVFNQDEARSQSAISNVMGSINSSGSGAAVSDKQKKAEEIIKKNYEGLEESERNFAKDYIDLFHKESGSSGNNWNKIVSAATTESSFISPDDLNKIYNSLKSSNKDTSLFSGHLITKIESGTEDKWGKYFNVVEKEKENKKEEAAPVKTSAPEKEVKEVKAINNSSGEEEKKKNVLKIFVDKEINPTLNAVELFDLLTKYSVRYFDLKTSSSEGSGSKSTQNKRIWASSIYSQNGNNLDQSLLVLSINKSSDYGIFKNFLFPVICALLFLVSVFAFIIKSYRGPGLIFSGSVILGLMNVLALFFTLGSQLSLVGISALVAGLFYSFFISFYFLSFLKKLFKVEYLDKDNIFVSFKRGMVFSVDLTLPLFVLSVLIAFLAPIHLREFGILLSLSILVFFLFVAVCAPLLTLKYISSNFLSVSNLYSSIIRRTNSRESWINKYMVTDFDTRRVRIGFALIVGVILVAAIVFGLFGINSFSLFKNNYLVTFFLNSEALNSGENLGSVQTALSEENILKTLSSGVIPLGSNTGEQRNYLLERFSDWDVLSNLLKGKLNEKNYLVQETASFNDALDLKDLLLAVLFSFLLISCYVFIRFGFRNLFILWINNFLSLSLLLSVIVILRIAVYPSLFLAMSTFIAISVMYHIYWFNSARLFAVEWFNRGNDFFLKDMASLLKFSILAFLACSLLSTNTEIIILNFYIFLSLVTVHYLSRVIFLVLDSKLFQFKEKHLWKTRVETEESIEENNLDPYDEEIIAGINKQLGD